MRLRGREYRRHLLAAAALHDIFTVGELATAIGVSPGTVQGWWRGAQPKAETLPKIARATGYRTDELYAWVYEAGEPPHFPDSEEQEAQHRAARAVSAAPASEAPHAHHGKAGSGRRP